MKIFSLRRIIVVCVLLLILILGWWYFVDWRAEKTPKPTILSGPQKIVIGISVQGRNIDAYTFGTGQKPIVFVGGIHGGYEWNTVLLAYQAIDYLTAHSEIIPDDLTVIVIPVVNPDGVFQVTQKTGRFTIADVANNLPKGTGRFNSQQVDLNRNFACNWQATSTWQGNIVSAGKAPFSEPEAKTFRDFILKTKPTAVIFWHSQANAVYASECNNGILPTTLNLMNVYAQASKYPAVKSFDSYVVTGDAEGWLASINIPAITVELQTHETIEWERNLAGIKAVFDYYRPK